LSGLGIPTTDDEVGFEDLMVFALNFDVNYAKTPAAPADQLVRLTWAPVTPDVWSLVLLEPADDLKGVHLVGDLLPNSVTAVTEGELLSAQAGPCFVQNATAWGLDVGMALLGFGLALEGHGELFRVQFDDAYDLNEVTIELRSSSNQAVEFVLEEVNTDVPELPADYTLAANYPNPFNPATTIEFALPTAERVELLVFAVDGRQIATLVAEQLPAGHHAVTWNGRNQQGEAVASGIYFYRLQAGRFSQTQKMTLLK
jgi:hypothetical protein